MPATPPQDTPPDDASPDDTPIPPPTPYTPVPPSSGQPPEPPGAGPSLPPPSPYSPPPTPPAPMPYQAGGQVRPVTTLSLLAMIFGIVGVAVSCCYGAGFLFSVTGVVLGHLGLKREPARGMALTGLITGYVGVGGAILFWVLLILVAFVPLMALPFMAYGS